MADTATRYRNVAGRFTATARAVPPEKWDALAPCEGWVARDVVRHMVEWMPYVLGEPLAMGEAPSTDDDPLGAWLALDDAITAALDDPARANATIEVNGSTHRFDDAVATFCLGDVLVHTWDLARAAGLDETLDPDEVHALLAGMEPIDEILRQSGHYGPKVEVPPGASEQDRLIAFTGRRP